MTAARAGSDSSPQTGAVPQGRTRIARVAAAALPVVFILIWSSGYLVGTVGAHAGPPLALVSWRFLVAFVVLGAVSLVTRAPWPTQPRTYLHLLVAGALLQTAQLGGVYVGLAAGVPAALSSLILSAAPLVVAAAAVPLFAERLTGRQWIGLGLGLLGVCISLGESLSGGGLGPGLVGYVATGLALIGFAAGTLYQKRFGTSVDLRTGGTVQLAGATITSFPLALAHGGIALPLTAPALGSLAWLAIVNSIGAITLLFILLRQRSGGAATSLLYLVPPVTALLGVPLLGQSLTVSIIVGMAVSGAGVVLVLTRSRRRTARTPQVAASSGER